MKTFQEAQDELLSFRDERGWEKYHRPEALARAIAVEAGELNELFLWCPVGGDPAAKFPDEVRDELADVLIYCLNLCNVLGEDGGTLIAQKIAKNRTRRVVDARLSK